MKYTGRIVLLLLVCTTTIGWMLKYYHIYGVMHWEEIYYNVPILILGWFLGKRHDQATFYAHYDLLTHVYNRNYLQKIIPKMLRKVSKTSGQLTVFIIDIDNFKDINDTYGHRKGDQVLESIASIIKNDIRKTDVVGRLGGDEFLVGIQNIQPNMTQTIINRWKEKLTSFEKEMDVNITISVGTSNFPADGLNLDELYHAADVKMYADKHNSKQALLHV
jgi:diguanylate cyclase (GGDEF)-like protein